MMKKSPLLLFFMLGLLGCSSSLPPLQKLFSERKLVYDQTNEHLRKLDILKYYPQEVMESGFDVNIFGNIFPKDTMAFLYKTLFYKLYYNQKT